METWQHGWTLLSSLVLPTLIRLPDLSQAAARRWVTGAGEGPRSWRDLGLTTAQRASPDGEQKVAAWRLGWVMSTLKYAGVRDPRECQERKVIKTDHGHVTSCRREDCNKHIFFHF